MRTNESPEGAWRAEHLVHKNLSGLLFFLTALLFTQLARAEAPSAAMLYRQGKLHYDNDRFDQALHLFDRVVSQHPQDPVAEYAANLSLDILNMKRDYAALEKLARRYAADAVLMKHQSLRETISKLLPQLSFKNAQQMFEKEEHSQAAEAFLKVADQHPKSIIADSALYNAALSFKKAGRKKRALEVHRRLVREYPQSRLARRASEILKNSATE